MTQHPDNYTTLLVTIEIIPRTLLVQLESHFDNVIYKPDSTDLPNATDYATADVLYTLRFPSNLTSIQQTPKLKLIQLHSAGVNHIYPSHPFFLTVPPENPLILASASGVHVSPIAEHSLATTMMLLHKINILIVRGHVEQTWVRETIPSTGYYVVRELRGMRVGILGYGHIGRETARMFKAMGSDVVAATRDGVQKRASGYIVPGTGDDDGSIPSQYYSTSARLSFATFLSTCGVIINTLPSSAATIHIMGKEEFKLMKGNSIFVNIGRGDTVVQSSLLEALEARLGEGEMESDIGTLRIGGASLDVTDPEPLEDGHPFYTLPNVVLTPHMSGLSVDYFTRTIDLLVKNVELLRSGKGALNAVRGKGEDLM